MKQETEYDKFENLASGLLKVSHAELKAKLDDEKQAKKKKKVKEKAHDAH